MLRIGFIIVSSVLMTSCRPVIKTTPKPKPTDCNFQINYNKYTKTELLNLRRRPNAKDKDGDGIPNSIDNCVDRANPLQEDCDGDGIGDICNDSCFATPPPPPPPAYDTSLKEYLVLLDFDGHYLTSVFWVSNPFPVGASGLTSNQTAAIVDSCRRMYAGYKISFTTNESIYNTYAVNKRQRIVITQDHEWYGAAGGVAYVGSMFWNTDVEGFVFSKALAYRSDYSSHATVHEIGHTLGLEHQNVCNGTVYVSEYNPNTGFTTAPVMGNSYGKRAVWWIGLSNFCSVVQNDTLKIRAALR